MKLTCQVVRTAIKSDPDVFTKEFQKAIADHMNGCKPCQEHYTADRAAAMAEARDEIVKMVTKAAEQSGIKANVSILTEKEALEGGAALFKRLLSSPEVKPGAPPVGLPEAEADGITIERDVTIKGDATRARVFGTSLTSDGSFSIMLCCPCERSTQGEACWNHDYVISRRDAENIVKSFQRMFKEWDQGDLKTIAANLKPLK